MQADPDGAIGRTWGRRPAGAVGHEDASPPLPYADKDAAAADTLGGAGAIAPETVPAGAGEPTHVEGAAADLPAGPAWSAAPETVPLTAARVLPLAIPVPDVADTLVAAGGAVIQLLESGETPADVQELGFQGLGELEAKVAPMIGRAPLLAAQPAALETQRVALRDPASVAGASVLAIGAATVVLADLAEAAVPERDPTLAAGRVRVAAAAADNTGAPRPMPC